MAKMIRWLHISDLHFNDDDMSTTALRESLLPFLRKKNWSFDYIFCTGDIRTAPKDFPDEAASYLRSFCREKHDGGIGVPLRNLFIVPGNHDVNRDLPARNAAIKKVFYRRKGTYSPKYGTIESSALNAIHEGQKEFRQFLTKVYGDAVPDRLAYYQQPQKPHFVIKTPDFNILHVDTTLSYTKGQEANDLIVGTKLLQDALKDLEPTKPVILLTHYPITALYQEERKYVSELLHQNGVKLWLAGHEHDYDIQPIKYIQSFQAGELRMEDGTKALVLIGEYDPDTQRGTLYAYSWFPEGWAKYPIIWHDGMKEDEYSFSLGLPQDKGISREALQCMRVNQEFIQQRLSPKIIAGITPQIGLSSTNSTNLLQVLKDIWNTDSPHLILLGDGGMGKTTMLLMACQRTQKPIIYIPAERLQALNMELCDYCVQTLYKGEREVFQKNYQKKFQEPSLIIFLDGLNEISAPKEEQYIREIQQLNLLQGIQIVITSRSDFTTRYSLYGYQVGRLMPLSDEQLQKMFNSKEWKNISDTVTLHQLLRTPMMLSMYKEVSPLIERYKDKEFLDWHWPVSNTTDLLHDYYVAQIAVLLGKTGIQKQDLLIVAQIVFNVLPCLGYAFENRYILNLRKADFRKLLDEVLSQNVTEENKFDALMEYCRVYNLPRLNRAISLDWLINNLNLLYEDDTFISFSHQIYRDFLSASWIVENTVKYTERIWNTRLLTYPVMEHIRNMSGDYWNGIAKAVHEKGKNRNNIRTLVENILACFPVTESSGQADYSNLDFNGVRLPDIKMVSVPISLDHASVNRVTLGLSRQRITYYSYLSFSEDNRYLAVSTDSKINIYDLETGKCIFTYDIGRKARLYFCGKYLFAITYNNLEDEICIFRYNGFWEYRGCFGDERLLNKRLKLVILKDSVLFFYYNNRERRYCLDDGKLLYDEQRIHAWKNPVDGVQVDFSSHNGISSNKNEQIVCQINHCGWRAIAYKNGKLIISKGKELYRVLEKGAVSLLKDAAFSDDGNRAAILTQEVFAGQRRVQIWDIDKKIKIKDIWFPEKVDYIHMSDTGKWILGETDTDILVSEIETENSKWCAINVIPNQRGRWSFYQDKVLCRDEQQHLCMYDLQMGKYTNITEKFLPGDLACFMPNNSVAVVNNNAQQLLLVNSKTGKVTDYRMHHYKITGIQSFRHHPFVAVSATDEDRIISIYHTKDGQRKRKLPAKVGNKIMIVHPDVTVIANSGGGRSFETHHFFEKIFHGKKCGWWYDNTYQVDEGPAIFGTVLDMAFNKARHELVVIFDNGLILFCHEKYCRYHDKIEIITSFNVDNYDFSHCICDNEVRKILEQNGVVFSD